MPGKTLTKKQLAEQALAASGIRVEKLSPEQRKKIVARLVRQIPAPPKGGARQLQPRAEFFPGLACIACKGTLNTLGAIPIALLLGAGAVVAPEAEAVVAIAELFGVEAAAVASVVNTALSAGAASAEVLVNDLCVAFGAC